MKHVMLICTSGLTSNILLSRMLKIVFAHNLPLDIKAFSTHEALEEFKNNSYDAILLSPQVRFFKDEMGQAMSQNEVPIEIISMKDYGLMDAQSILDSIQKLISE